MKKLVIIKIAFVFTAIFYCGITGAQTLAMKRSKDVKVQSSSKIVDDMFKVIHDRSDHNMIRNPRILRHFTERFADISDVQWYMVNYGMLAKFIQQDIPYTVGYDENGAWKHTIKYLAKRHIPIDLSKKVDKKYANYTLLRAHEIHVPNHQDTIYIVQLQNEKQIKHVRFSKGNALVVRSMKRWISE
ncbi:hypothetical protein H8S90_20185 [Olivibacter sp. SDN3]|uniref:hypothetical protein n=1 Tax=Olivibacter sp. SDN3 TaxID=2764720 RepID=UPI001650ED10|nr:hypothetical protein [Olivibacter sp. SDN3]QNL49044.1 hypothetical protein H8S90_20185 [Olivibacter sp. SDN3]